MYKRQDVDHFYDSGTEVNDASLAGGAAFIVGVDANLGTDENGVITMTNDLSEFAGAVTPNGIPISDATLTGGESFATIRIIEVPAGPHTIQRPDCSTSEPLPSVSQSR